MADDRATLFQSNRTSEFVYGADDAVRFKLVRDASDIEDADGWFHPEFTHQHFGEKETIFGYSNLRVNLLYSASDLQLYVELKHSGIISEKHKDIQPDDVLKLIADKQPSGFLTNLDEFSRKVEEQSGFRPFGTLIHSYASEPSPGSASSRQFEVYKVGESPGDVTPEFLAFYGRLQSFPPWFIDAASATDAEDDRWRHYFIFERVKEGGSERFFFVGYCSVYRYYAYPEHVRPRVAHVLVLPPFRRSGHGVELLQAVYRDVAGDKSVIELTAEDPSDNFIHLRDFVDCLNCSRLPCFQPKKLREGFSAEMAKEARERLKIGKKQCRRVYEILRLKETSCGEPEELRAYRLDVKKRLYQPFRREKGDWNKLVKVLNPLELSATVANLSGEQIKAQLNSLYEQTVQDYRYTLNRLATHAPLPDAPLNGHAA